MVQHAVTVVHAKDLSHLHMYDVYTHTLACQIVSHEFGVYSWLCEHTYSICNNRNAQLDMECVCTCI